MTCQDDANFIGKLALFVGIESGAEKWQAQQFVDLAKWAKQHGVTTLLIKVFEVGSSAGNNEGMWYSWVNGGYDAIYQAVKPYVNVVFYGFLWGSDVVQEAKNINALLQKYGHACLDMEGSSWVNQVAKAQELNNLIVNTPGKVWLSLPANPFEAGQGDTFRALSPSVNVYMPMAYNNYLTSKAIADMRNINPNACIMPTLDLSQEFGANDILGNAKYFKDRGCYGISLWYQGFAKQNPSMVDNLAKLYGGDVTELATKKWFEYPICVPFGNPNYDSLYGGSHDMDVQTPPNTEITFLLPGKIVDLQAPSWGKQVGVQLDTPYNGIPYMAYLHLAAINPALNPGKHVNAGDVVGWSGGCTSSQQYAGTSNPTGENFLNNPSQSSQPQTGVALMRGPIYGSGAGWENWTGHTDHSSSPLNPTQIILDARKRVSNVTQTQVERTTWQSTGQQQQSRAVWEVGKLLVPVLFPKGLDGQSAPGQVPTDNSGIKKSWDHEYMNGRLRGYAVTPEISQVNGQQYTDWNNGNRLVVYFSSGNRCEWDGKQAYWYE